MSIARAVRALSTKTPAVLPLAVLALTAMLPGAASADDRDLVRTGQRNPYVMILLDVSGSMHQSVVCDPSTSTTPCSQVCLGGDCLPRMSGDDPASKIATAKSAIYSIMQATDNVNFGFSTFDQDELRALWKHWWYRVSPTQANGFIQLDSGINYPDAGEEEVFGQAAWPCTDALGPSGQETAVRWIGCPNSPLISGQPANPVPSNLSDSWEWERARRYPKLDDNNGTTRYYYIRDNTGVGYGNGPIYKVTFTPIASVAGVTQVLGQATMQVSIKVDKCTNASCSTVTTKGTKTIAFNKANEFFYWEAGGSDSFKTSEEGSFYGYSARMVTTGNASGTVTNLSAWDSNFDTNDAATFGTTVDVRQTTVNDPRGNAFGSGDVLPLDWTISHKIQIEQRVAPNLIGGATTPDFQMATYFQDHRLAGETILRLKDTTQRPLVPEGGTPTGGAMQSFIDYLKGKASASPAIQSWLTAASNSTTGDASFTCRQTFLILITDGLASDGNTACTEATSLATLTFNGNPYPVKTFVIGLGLTANTPVPTGYTDTLKCVATNGLTGAPLYPQDQNALIQALTNILKLINSETRSFAAAAVPSVQANTEDKVILSNFTPVNKATWPGHVYSFVKPIPLHTIILTLADGTTQNRSVPDESASAMCTSSSQTACWSWDGAQQLLGQAANASAFPNPTTNPSGVANFNLGTGAAQRRVYYSLNTATVPNERDFFQYPTDTTHWTDLLAGLGVCTPFDTVCGALAANLVEAKKVMQFVHSTATYVDPNGVTQTYLLGDIFHSDPVEVSAPANFTYFGPNVNNYRDFYTKHRYRREIVLVGSNDGQMHVFDAGQITITGTSPNRARTYTNGTGNELFAYVPRPIMPILKTQADAAAAGGGTESYMVDGSTAVDDVFINTGFNGSPSKAEWRTVAIGSLREGGSGYFALDVTQPDTLTNNVDHRDPDDTTSPLVRIPQPLNGYVPSCGTSGTNDPSCGSLPFPSVLWEFTDSCKKVSTCTTNCQMQQCDEDASGVGAGQPDLGETWSLAEIGRIKVCTNNCDPTSASNDIQDKYVAIFGGGMDPNRNNAKGNYLYMVDIESGQVIYKRQLVGSTPSEVAAVDTDLDGYIDTLYVGTVAGYLYKVDVRAPGQLKVLTNIGTRVDPNVWKPFQIFNTENRPIYYPPAVIYSTQLGQYALAFGTGDRENLWAASAVTGRFYVILDSNLTASTTGLPFTAASYQQISAESTTNPTGADFLINNTNPAFKNGWYIELATGERVVAKPFSLSGVTTFSSYQPTTILAGSGSSAVCGNTGTSRLFVVDTTSGNKINPNATKRYVTVSDFVTSPFTEQGQTKNSLGSSSGAGTDSAALTSDQLAIMGQLQKLFPSNCRFANYTINIRAVRSDTGLEFLAPVPVCIIEKNWKEF